MINKADTKFIDHILRFVDIAETQMTLREAAETIAARNWLLKIKNELESDSPAPSPVKREGMNDLPKEKKTKKASSKKVSKTTKKASK